MKFWYVFLFLSFVFSCQKERIDHPEILGKWKLWSIVDLEEGYRCNLDTTLASSQDLPLWFYCGEHYINEGKIGDITVEVIDDGRLIFHSNLGQEKFRVKKVIKKEFDIRYKSGDLSKVSGYNFYLSDSKGKKFEFKFFYSEVLSSLVGVAWYKGIGYSSAKEPVKNGVFYGTVLPQNYFASERLGLFIRE